MWSNHGQRLVLACLFHIQIESTHVPPEVRTTVVHPTDMAPLFIHHVQVFKRFTQRGCKRLGGMNTYALPTNSARLDRRLVLSRNLGRVWDASLSGKIASAGGGGRGCCLSSGPRTLGSPRIQGPNKAYSSAVIVTSPDYRREPAGYADVKQTHHKRYTDGQ